MGFKKGHGAFRKGFKLSKEHRQKLVIAHTGVKLSKEHAKRIGEGGRGIKKPFTEEHCKKLSIAHIGVQSGEKHPNWKGGISPENIKIRSSIENKYCRKACLKRDNFTCQKYGIRGGILVVHHINNFSEFPELRFEINNGITLSLEAHKLFHKTYGVKHNTKEQLLDFLNTK